MICRTCSCIIDDCGVGHHPTCPDEAAWLCGRGHTTQQPTCPACHDVAYARRLCASERDAADAGYYPARALLKTWIAEDSALPTAVLVDAALHDEILAALEVLCYLTHREFCATCGEWDCETHGYHDLLARVRAAREGR